MGETGNGRATAEDLICILKDKSKPEAERDDAAMDLGKFYDDGTIQALIETATSNDESEVIVGSCGESLGEIFVYRAEFDQSILWKLPEPARSELRDVLRKQAPHLLDESERKS